MKSSLSLTRRQKQVLELMRQGMPTRLIAEQLSISVNTVKQHRSLILKRMEVSNTMALICGMNEFERPSIPAVEAAKTPRVLVVEDDESTRTLVVSGLQLAGFESQGVESGPAMRTSLAGAGAHAVVLDLNLGDEDGLDLAAELRETWPSTGIVIMTIRSMVEDRIEGLLKGADTYLVKPVDIRELVAVIRNLMRRQSSWVPLA